MIGLDIGTSSAKAIAITREGRVVATAGRSYALQHPQPGYAEQDPETLLQAALECLADVLARTRENVIARGISISTAMTSILRTSGVSRFLSSNQAAEAATNSEVLRKAASAMWARR